MRRRRASGLSVLAALLLIGAATPAAASALGTGTIEGTVTRASDGAPVEGVLVCAWAKVGDEFNFCPVTAADGTYSLEGLEPGDYVVEFFPGDSGQNLALQFFDHREHWREADKVAVGEGTVASGVDAELGAGAAISGKVTRAATGAPLPEIRVCAIVAAGNELDVCDHTNLSGDYVLRYLPADGYKVVFSLDLNEWVGEERFLPENDGFSPVYWNGRTSLEAAEIVTVATGGSVGGIDASLGPPPSPPPTIGSPAPAPAPVPPPRKRCRKGWKAKKVHGRYRCVKRKRHRGSR